MHEVINKINQIINRHSDASLETIQDIIEIYRRGVVNGIRVASGFNIASDKLVQEVNNEISKIHHDVKIRFTEFF